jgi:predicted transcriptional regulator
MIATYRAGVTSTRQVVFTIKLEPELREQFIAEAQALHRPASQVVRDPMREFVRRQREAREYEAFVRRKVEAGRSDLRAGRSRAQAEVEADFSARREQLLRQAGEAGA